MMIMMMVMKSTLVIGLLTFKFGSSEVLLVPNIWVAFEILAAFF